MTRSDDPSDYLWDRTGVPDPEVRALEDLLRPLAHDARTLPPAAPLAAVRRPAAPRRRRPLLVLASLAGAALVLVALARRGLEPPPSVGLPDAAPAPRLSVASRGALAEAEWLEAADDDVDLVLGERLGRFTLRQGSLMQVRRLGADLTRLYLERGELHAFVSAEARPRFFQVDTPAARCVDLGCRYTLAVDEAGDAFVRVLTGRVAFENEGREAFVPAGALCRASRSRGPGTPRFEEAPAALVRALDAYDLASDPATRRARAAEVVANAASEEDALVLWHLLQDADDEVAAAAAARLATILPLASGPPAAGRPAAEHVAAWRDELERLWW
jgi:hypothetical protein